MDVVRVSKRLSCVLRHRPGSIGVALDDPGWADVDALLAALTAHGLPLTPEELDRVVATSDKRGFAFDASGRRIRASVVTARAVDGRRGRPVVRRVDARRMAAKGHPFTCSANGLRLVDCIPP